MRQLVDRLGAYTTRWIDNYVKRVVSVDERSTGTLMWSTYQRSMPHQDSRKREVQSVYCNPIAEPTLLNGTHHFMYNTLEIQKQCKMSKLQAMRQELK